MPQLVTLINHVSTLYMCLPVDSCYLYDRSSGTCIMVYGTEDSQLTVLPEGQLLSIARVTHYSL